MRLCNSLAAREPESPHSTPSWGWWTATASGQIASYAVVSVEWTLAVAFSPWLTEGRRKVDQRGNLPVLLLFHTYKYISWASITPILFSELSPANTTKRRHPTPSEQVSWLSRIRRNSLKPHHQHQTSRFDFHTVLQVKSWTSKTIHPAGLQSAWPWLLPWMTTMLTPLGYFSFLMSDCLSDCLRFAALL